MEVKLLQASKLEILIEAIRNCYSSQSRSDSVGSWVGPKDMALIQQVITSGHTSTLEHLVYTFKVSGVSRGLLQEFARHRIASLSVKSTRYTLKELLKEETFTPDDVADHIRAAKYLVSSGNIYVDHQAVLALENLRRVLCSGIANDKAKYCLPESYRTEMVWSINARSLRNFLELRSAKEAHWEIRELAGNIYYAVPAAHHFLFKDIIYKPITH